MFLKKFVCLLALLTAAVTAPAQGGPSALLVVIDGLRPDYVTPDLMPNLAQFGAAGIVFENHHAVYPTVTRVNASSMVTGCYPGAHGLMDNAVYIPEADPDKALSAADRENLEKIEAATGGKLLLVPTLGEILADAGKPLFVASSGSTGSAYLLNHKVKAGAVLHCEYTLPASMDAHVKEVLGPVPPEEMPKKAWNARVTDAFLKIGVDEMKAPVAILWYSDPDHTAHVKGIGSPETKDALQNVDMEFGRLIAGLKERGLDGKINTLVTSDHGFSTGRGKESLDAFVTEYIREKRLNPNIVVRAGYGLYFKEGADTHVPDLVMRLQALPWIGAIFTDPMFPGAPFGVNPGALSFGTVHYENPRNPDIVVSPDWNDEANEFGYKGTTTARGHGHGSSSPWDVHNTLLAGGPAFKANTRIVTPSSNIDLAPTLLKLSGMAKADSMQGRVLAEALKDGPDPASIKVEKRVFRAQMTLMDSEGTAYTQEAQESQAAGVGYIDFVKATRAKGQAAFAQPGAAAPEAIPQAVPQPGEAPAAPTQ